MDEVAAEQIPPKDHTLLGRIRKAVKTLRWWMVLPLPALVVLASSFGPSGWKEPLERILFVSWVAIFLALAHGARRVFIKKLDLTQAVEDAHKGNVAAAILSAAGMIFMAMVFLGIVSYAKAQDVKTYIPTNARALLPMLKEQQAGYWPEHPAPSYFGALIEHESCIGLTHNRCWNPKAQLKTSREEGASLGQFTRAWREDGSLRFDAIAEVKALDPEALREFSWSTVYARADLSMRAILVKQRDCYRRVQRLGIEAPMEIVALCDSSYNGGYGGMQQDRRLCAAEPGCDPNRWFGHVERFSLKSRTKWQGYGKSAFEINRHHVVDVLQTRRGKYRQALGEDRT